MPLKTKTLLLAAIFSLTACQSLKTRDQVKGQPRRSETRPTTPGSSVEQSPSSSSEEPAYVEEEPPVIDRPSISSPVIPKVGLILGPGGARAFAHIGMLQEFQKEKIPVVGVAGVEWGALIGAFYSMKGLANEAEWQMSKLKAEDISRTGWLSGAAKPADAKALADFLRLGFGKAKADGGRLPFACPALNLAKNQIFLMRQGQFDQMLPYCVAYPPAFRPWQGNVAAMREVKQLADHLRARGATVIVLANVLPPPNPNKALSGEDGSAESVLWNEIASFYSRPIPGVDHVLTLPLGSAGLTSFDDRRDLQQKGSTVGAPLVKQLSRKLGL